MSNSIDQRIVEMQFDNEQFESGVKESLSTIDELKKSLNFEGSVKGFDSISKAANDMRFDGIQSSLDALVDKFSVKGEAIRQIVRNLTNSAQGMITGWLTAIPRQIAEGGFSRAMNIEDAKFQLQGLKVEWKKIYDDINYGVADTAYGLDAAAKAAAQLVASGVQFGETFGETGNSPMAKALRGISGVAAMTNSTYEEISPIFTTVAGQGKLMTMQLRQLESRGLNAAATLAKSLGTTEQNIRDMVSKGKINFEMFSKAMDDAFGEHATAANNTYAGSLGNMKFALSKIGEPLQTARIQGMVGVFNALREQFNGIRKAITPLLTSGADNITIALKALAAVIKSFDLSWPVFNVIKGISNLLGNLLDIVAQVIVAFREMFQVDVNKGLLHASKRFLEFTERLKLTGKELGDIRDFLKGLLAPLKVLLHFIDQIISTINPNLTGLRDLITKGLHILGIIGRVGTYLADLIIQSNKFKISLDGIKNVLGTVGRFIGGFVLGVFQLVGAFVKLIPFESILNGIGKALQFICKVGLAGIGLLAKGVEKLVLAFKDLSGLATKLKTTVSGITTGFLGLFSKKAKESSADMKQVGLATKEVTKTFEELGASSHDTGMKFGTLSQGVQESESVFGKYSDTLLKISEVIKKIGTSILNFVKNINYQNLALLAFSVSVLKIAKSFSKMGGMFDTIGGGFKKATSSIAKFFDTLAKNAIKSNKYKPTLKEVALLIGVLSASLALLTFVDYDALKQRAILLGEIGAGVLVFLLALTGIEAILKKINPENTMGAVAKTLIGLAAGIALLVFAYKQLSGLSDTLPDIGKKLLVLAGVATTLVVGAKILAKGTPEMTKGAIGIIALAAGIAIIVKSLNSISPDSISDAIATAIQLVPLFLSLAVLGVGVRGFSIGSVLGLIAFLLVFNNALPAIKKLIEQIGSIDYSGIVGKIERHKELVYDLGLLAVAMTAALGFAGKGLRQVGIALGILATDVMLFALVSKYIANTFDEKNKLGWIVAASSLGVMLTFFAVLEALSKNTEKSRMMPFAISMGILAAAVRIMFGAVNDLQNMDWAQLIALGGTLALVLAAFAVIEKEAANLKDVKATVMLPFVIGLLTVMLTLNYFTTLSWNELTPALLAVGGALLTFMLVINALTKLGKEKIPGSVVAILYGTVLQIGMLMAAMVVLSSTVKDPFILALSILGIIGVMTSFGSLIKTLQSFKGTVTTKNRLLMMLELTAVLGVIGTSLYFISKNDWSSIAASGAAIVASMLAIGHVVKTLNGLKNYTNQRSILEVLELIGMICGLLAVMAGSIALVTATKANWTEIGAASAGIILGIMALSSIVESFNKIKVYKNQQSLLRIASYVGTVAGAIVLIGTALRIATKDNANWASILASTVPMIATLITLVGAIAVLNSMGSASNWSATGQILSEMLVASLMITAIGNAIKNIATGNDWKAILASAVAMVGVFTYFTIILAALAALSTVSEGIGLYAILGVAGAMVILAGAVTLLGIGLKKAAEGFDIGAKALAILFEAFYTLEQHDMKAICDILPKLALGIGLLGAVAVVLGALSDPVILGSKAIVILTDALSKMIALDLSSLESGVLLEIAKGLTAIGLSGIALTVGSVGILVFAESLNIAAPAIEGIIGAITRFTEALNNLINSDVISMLVENFTGLGERTVVEFQNGVSSGAKDLPIVGKQLVSMLVSGIKSSNSEYSNAGADTVKGITNSINKNKSSLLTAGLNMGLAILNGFREGYQWHSPPAWTGLAVADTKNALVRGLQYNNSSISKAAVACGSAIPSSILLHTGEWTAQLFRGTGQMVRDGILAPLTDYIGKIQAAISGLGANIDFSGLKNTITNIWNSTTGVVGVGNKAKQLFSEVSKNVKGLSFDLRGAADKAMDLFGVPQTMRDAAFKAIESGDIGEGFKSILKDCGVDVEGLTNQVTEMGDKAMEAFGDMGAAAEGAGGKTKATKEEIKNLTETIKGQIDIFSEYKESEKISAKQMLENMKSQVKGVAAWSYNIANLAEKGIDQGLLKTLAELGPKGADKVAAFAEMTAEEMKQANYLYAQSLILPDAAAKLIGDSYGKAQKGIGNNLVQGLVNGIIEKRDEASKAAALTAEEVVAAEKEVLGINSPSKVAYSDGSYWDMGLRDGIKAFANIPIDAAKFVANSILTEFKSILGSTSASDIAGEMTTSLGDAIKNTVSGIKTKNNDGESVGQNIITNINTGITKFKDTTVTLVSELTTNLYNIVDQLATDALTEGGKFVENLTTGIKGMYRNAQIVGTELSTKVVSGIKVILPLFKEAGKNAGQGFIDGIKDKYKDAEGAGAELAKIAYEAAKKELDEHSPSKKLERVGEFGGLGFINGIRKTFSKVEHVSSDLGDIALTTMQKAMAKAEEVLDADMEINPVITPVLDLTDVMNKSDTIDTLLNGKTIGINNVRSAAGTINANRKAKISTPQIQNEQPSVTNYNFTQNNTSPKALSRLDIYRQTKNQFTQFQMGVDNA